MGNQRRKVADAEEHVPLPKTAAIIYSDVQRSYFPTEEQYITERDADRDAHLIGDSVTSLGIDVRFHPGDADLPARLYESRPEVVINLVDSVKGLEHMASAIPGVLELLDLPYTGADVFGLALGSNKFLVKKLLQQHGVPVPYFQLFAKPSDPIDPTIRFPLISKLNSIHGGVEITADAVSETEKHLRKRLRYLIRTYKQPVLVEEFISGREVTAIALQDGKKRVYMAEKVFARRGGRYVFLTFEDQWLSGSDEAFRYKKYTDPLLKEYVKTAFTVTGMAGYGKFDIRRDQSGRYFFIDANPNPALGPKELAVATAVIADMYGVPFDAIMRQIIRNALRAPRHRAAGVEPSAAGVLGTLPEVAAYPDGE